MNKALAECNGNIRIYIEVPMRDIKPIMAITAVKDVDSTQTLNPILSEDRNLAHLRRQDVKMMT